MGVARQMRGQTMTYRIGDVVEWDNSPFTERGRGRVTDLFFDDGYLVADVYWQRRDGFWFDASSRTFILARRIIGRVDAGGRVAHNRDPC